MIVGSLSKSGGNAQPPPLLNPHEKRRLRVSDAQSVKVGANACQLYQTLPPFSRSA